MPIQIAGIENPPADDVKVILNGLLEFNTAECRKPENKPFAVFLRDTETGQVLGGAHTIWSYDWLYVTMLFIPETLRGKGFGKKLLDEVETHARQQKSKGVWLDTFTFQAPGFYEKAGYEKFGELTDFPPGHNRIFYRKMLK